jgi:hypothetical protein
MFQLSLFDDESPSKPRPTRNDVMMGDAAEASTAAKLLKWGYAAHWMRRDAAYDLVVDLMAGRICRVQVKAIERSRKGKWNFRLVRGNPRTGNGSRPYLEHEYDITAFFALSLESVIFLPGVHSRARFSNADFRHPGGDIQSWERALKVFTRKPLLNQ